MSVRQYRQKMLILLIFAQTFLAASGLFDLLEYSLFHVAALMTAMIVFGVIIFLKFFWHIQDMEVDLSGQMRGSHFGAYMFASLGLPFIFMTPFILLYLGVHTNDLIKIGSVMFLLGAVLFEVMMFNRLVDYFCEDETE